MSLDTNDIQTIQNLMNVAVAPVLESFELRFDGLENKVDGLESKVDRLGNKVDGLENKVDELEVRMDGLENHMSRVEKRIDTLEITVGKTNSRLDSIESKLLGLENDIKEIYTMIFKNPPTITGATDKEKILKMYDIVLAMAKKLDISLPR